MAIAIVPILMVVVGLLVYLLSTQNAKAAESGRLCLLAGLIGIAVAYATHLVHLG